jgi:Ca-activated chloride channel family protein
MQVLIEPETGKTIWYKIYHRYGTNGMAESSIRWTKWSVLFQMMKVEIDEQLKKVSKKTDGRYFRATKQNKLVYGEINKPETTEIEELKFYDYDEKYRPFVWLVLLLAEIGLRNTIYKVLFKS